MVQHECTKYWKQVNERWVDNTCFGVMCRKEYKCKICGKIFVQYNFPRYTEKDFEAWRE